jgi:hypothetical protein
VDPCSFSGRRSRTPLVGAFRVPDERTPHHTRQRLTVELGRSLRSVALRLGDTEVAVRGSRPVWHSLAS